jgi:small subunit ribosomal protein S16
MAVKIRLARHGAKKRPFYRVVAADVQSPRDGKFLEMLGTYNPLQEPAEVSLNVERVSYWLDQGAIPTNTVKTLLKNQGISLKPS